MQTGASPEQNPTYSDSKRKAKTHLKKNFTDKTPGSKLTLKSQERHGYLSK